MKCMKGLRPNCYNVENTNIIKMVFIVLMVSTSDCGSASMGSNPINHPIQRVTQVGEGGSLLNC